MAEGTPPTGERGPASSDGVGTPGASGAPGCDPRGPYRFCDDFDHDGRLDDGRWQTAISGSGDLALDKQSLSPPVAARTSIGPGAKSIATLLKDLPLVTTRARAELDLRVDVDLSRIEAGTSLVAIGLPSGEHAGLALTAGKVVLQYADATLVLRQSALEPFPIGAWTHLVLEITFDESDGRVFVSAGGEILADKRGLVMRSSSTKAAVFRFGAGVSGVAEVPVALRVDNVKVF